MKIYLIAGEPSGDMLGARLMHALKELAPEAEFAGVGGENMKEEGLKSLFDISDLAVMGLAEVIPSIPKVLRRIRETVADIAAQKPDIKPCAAKRLKCRRCIMSRRRSGRGKRDGPKRCISM